MKSSYEKPTFEVIKFAPAQSMMSQGWDSLPMGPDPELPGVEWDEEDGDLDLEVLP